MELHNTCRELLHQTQHDVLAPCLMKTSPEAQQFTTANLDYFILGTIELWL